MAIRFSLSSYSPCTYYRPSFIYSCMEAPLGGYISILHIKCRFFNIRIVQVVAACGLQIIISHVKLKK